MPPIPRNPAPPRPAAGGNFLTRKAGPLPVWAWALLAMVVGYVAYKRYGASAGTASAVTPAPSTGGQGGLANPAGQLPQDLLDQLGQGGRLTVTYSFDPNGGIAGNGGGDGSGGTGGSGMGGSGGSTGGGDGYYSSDPSAASHLGTGLGPPQYGGGGDPVGTGGSSSA